MTTGFHDLSTIQFIHVLDLYLFFVTHFFIYMSQLWAGGPVIPGSTFMLAGVGSGLCMCWVVMVTQSVTVMNTISILWAGTH